VRQGEGAEAAVTVAAVGAPVSSQVRRMDLSSFSALRPRASRSAWKACWTVGLARISCPTSAAERASLTR
jgi:hypothetical protein